MLIQYEDALWDGRGTQPFCRRNGSPNSAKRMKATTHAI